MRSDAARHACTLHATIYKPPRSGHEATQIIPHQRSRQWQKRIEMMRARGLLVLALVAAAACLVAVDGAGECGATPPDKMALKLAPCASAAQKPDAAPSSGCCNAVHTIGMQSPQCLCAVMLSKTAKKSGIKPEVAITIPKRCNLADRPVGYKCGGKANKANNCQWYQQNNRLIY